MRKYRWLPTIALLCSLTVTAQAKPRIPWQGSPYFITTQGARVADVLRDIGSNYSVPVIVSPQVNDSFTGSIRNEMPDAILEHLSQLFNLAVWYDGQALYVYKEQEVKSEFITPRYLGVDQLIAYLKRDGLATQQYCSLRLVSSFNALEIFGVPMCIERVSALAKTLDEKVLDQAQNQETVRVFPLRFATADDNTYLYRNQQVRVPGLVSVLQDIVRGRSIAGENAPTANAMTTTNVLPTFSADPRQNAVLVRDKEANMQLYAKLIKQLDLQPAQIEVSVVIIDVDASNLNSLGINWSGTVKLGSHASLGFNADPRDKGGTATGTWSTVLNDTNNFMVQISALEQHSKAKILSRPSVVTLNNVQAVLDRNVTFYTKLQGEKVAKLESVTTGSLLRVTPRLIDVEGFKQIMLTLNIQDGRQGQPIQGDNDHLPQVKSAEISTQATLAADQSLLLGGFVQDEQTQGNNKIPLLGDIPLLGQFFRHKNDVTRSVVRLFLIKAKPQEAIVAS